MDVNASFGGSASQEGQESTVESVVEPTEQGGNPWLNEVAPEHRGIVAPYLKKWDQESTKKFQSWSEKHKPYEALGSAEELAKYRNFAENFRQNPERVFKLMFESLQEQYGENFDAELLRILELEAEEQMNEYEYEQEYQEPPDSDQVFQQNVMQELEELRAWKEEQTQSQTSQQEQAQLDQFLEVMHTKFGDFDDDWVLLRLGEHGDPNKAIQQYKAFEAKIAGKNGTTPRQPPKTHSSGGQGGGVPNENINPAELRGEARRKAVLAMLGEE